MSSFGNNVVANTFNGNQTPTTIPDPLTINQINVNQIGDNSNP